MAEAADSRRRPWWPWLLLGLIIGGGAAAFAYLATPGFEEVEEAFPLASDTDIAEWTAQWKARTTKWQEVPDPRGEGRVVKARYWLSRAAYDMEVRRRGNRFVVAIAGVDIQFMGGGWAAVGEGRITGDAHSFRGAVATFTWSCLSARYRHASDGIGRIWFDEDGGGLYSIYMAYESPEIWAKAYGERHIPGEPRPAYATIRGQIPYTPAMKRQPDGALQDITVRVTDDTGAPLKDALVQLKAVDRTRVLTDAKGMATVSYQGRHAPYAQVVCAGLPGHRNAETAFFTGDAPERAEIVLPRLDPTDHAEYTWNRASGKGAPDDMMACGTCHEWYFAEWYTSRHARMASNGHVAWERARMVKADPQAPDDCRGCHQPAHAVQVPGGGWKARGELASNHCDFCHKIRAVKDIKESGVFGAYDVVRPDPNAGTRPGGIHHVFGPLPDSSFAYMGASYNPLFKASPLCAGCHQGGGRWRDTGLPKIDTFNEWLEWSSSQKPEDVRSCQDCHMPGASTFSTEGKLIDQLAWDGLHRSPEHVHSHRFYGSEPDFASKALDLKVEKRNDPDTGEWLVTVALTSRAVGHKVPTGTWSKHVVVAVTATVDGEPLEQISGDRTALGTGGFILRVRAASDTERKQGNPLWWQPWPKAQVVDERLKPGETRTATCRFERTPGAEPSVEVRVLHRRGWLPGGPASVPWTVNEYDAPPEVLWMRVVK